MYKAIIAASGFYVPDKVVTNDDLAEILETNDQWIVERTGIQERRYIEPGMSGAEMSEIATRRTCDEAGIDIDDIDCIIHATLSPDLTFPGNAPLLQDRLGLGGCAVIDIRNQCTGFVYSLSIADKFIRCGDFKTILVSGSEIHSCCLDFSKKGRDVSVIFGDGAGVMVIRAEDDDGKRGILASDLHGDGKGARKLFVEVGGSAAHYPSITHELIDAGKQFPQMNGRYVFMEAVKRLPETINQVLKSAGYALADVDNFIFHQANLRINQLVANSMEIPPEKVYNNIEKYGNTTAATIPIAFTEARQKGLIKEGNLVLIASFGAGFTWGSVLLRY